MPLSEEEQRLLDEMERNLYGSREDVHTATGASARLSSRGILVGFIGVLSGLALLVLGVATQVILLGAGGFVLMFAGIVGAMSIRPSRGSNSRSASDAAFGASRTSGSTQGRAKKQGFMSRLEDRWDQRDR